MRHLNKAFGRDIEDLDVLVVDDNAHMRKLVTAILTAFGVARIREADEGTAALREVEVMAPDLIISDWEMAPMDGCSFLAELRKQSNDPACYIPVIMLTAHGRPKLIRRAFDMGASQFLVKPLTPANLLQRIEWILADKREFQNDGDRVMQQMTFKVPSAAVIEAEQKVASDEAWTID